MVLVGVLAFLLFGIISLGSWQEFDAAVNSMLTVGGALAVTVVSSSDAVDVLVEKASQKLRILLETWVPSTTLAESFAKARAFEDELSAADDLAACSLISVLPGGRIHLHQTNETNKSQPVAVDEPWVPKEIEEAQESEEKSPEEIAAEEERLEQIRTAALATRGALIV